MAISCIVQISFQNYPGVDIKNFTTSWSDGLAFNAILHRWKPHLFDFNNIARKHPNARLDHAFRIAQEQLSIERLLDPEGKRDISVSVWNTPIIWKERINVHNIFHRCEHISAR